MLPFRTIDQTLDQLHAALRDYIEATYHIGHPQLISQRRALLDEVGTIRQVPYLESTPRYREGERFQEMGLTPPVQELLTALSAEPRVLHNPPYQHQQQALVQTIQKGRSLIVVTGTGSGKTECFLLPMLAKLACEASAKPHVFGKTAAVRALLLYPMNALVNDQLGRLRLMFGDDRVVNRFLKWAGRPARFARYTSRTLYPGVRTVERDQRYLSPLKKFYVRLEEDARGEDGVDEADAGQAQSLIDELRKRGKWPAKPDLRRWYGPDRTHWAKDGQFQRCVMGPKDPELLTRHEVLAWLPDVLVTNYSMLEYMLMRPIERPIFDQTRQWLAQNPEEKLLLVIDEAHLYRGAAGAEVALLLRRLRARLGIPPEQVQVICTSASFDNAEHAQLFAAQLSGKGVDDFDLIQGALALRPCAAVGAAQDAQELADVDLDGFYQAPSDEERLSLVRPFLAARGIRESHSLGRALYAALQDYPPLGELVNRTMQEAHPLDKLGCSLFPEVEPRQAMAALTSLLALGSLARPAADEPGLVPCRVHSFHSGLPGLWICMDEECAALPSELRSAPAGKLYGQPREACDCGARVLELFTCRNCGAAYARAYTDNAEAPRYLWAEQGEGLRTSDGAVPELYAVDLLLEEPSATDQNVQPKEFDLITGQLDPPDLGDRNRQVFIRNYDLSQISGATREDTTPSRHFEPCGVCRSKRSSGRSTLQDHQTAGDKPFQILVTRQLQVQPPVAKETTAFAPLRGRKVLMFSDSRQTAARLAANIQEYSFRDIIRPLLLAGLQRLQTHPQLTKQLTLQDLYGAILLGSVHLEVRLRPELTASESMDSALNKVKEFETMRQSIGMEDAPSLMSDLRSETVPQSLLIALFSPKHGVLTDADYGLESLALASLVERSTHTAKVDALPEITDIATTAEQKRALTRLWLRCWLKHGIWISHMPQDWWLNTIEGHQGNFQRVKRFLGSKDNWQIFEKKWLPKLLQMFAEKPGSDKNRLKGSELSVEVGGQWSYCGSCRTTQRPFPGLQRCVECDGFTAMAIDPETDPVFGARKGYYRKPVLQALQEQPEAPMAFVAAEHTAQLNTAQADEVFSTAEKHELLFQDIPIRDSDGSRGEPAIDVLSCTTTMEVGIDIGSLLGVALRNLPPARANYQQRAGRAGRRGHAVATVVAFASADSHDEHFFRHPDQIIRGAVQDPLLSLSNCEIARRHVTAFLLQRYAQERLPKNCPEDTPQFYQLFAVLGTVPDFLSNRTPLNRSDFSEWLHQYAPSLRGEVDDWLPAELSNHDRDELLHGLVDQTLDAINQALSSELQADSQAGATAPEAQQPLTATVAEEDAATSNEEIDLEDDPPTEAVPETIDPASGADAHAAIRNLLPRLLYKGVLPRYAFPTDVATFYVFDAERFTYRQPAFLYTPSQALPVALSGYAPGREVWIDGKLWRSGAVYSPFVHERKLAWQNRRWYYECSQCGYSYTQERLKEESDDRRNCRACGREDGIERQCWMRPPGFAHPIELPPGTRDEQSERSYATRARLTGPTPRADAGWKRINERVRLYSGRECLLVTNRGSNAAGYHYCRDCGRIEDEARQQHVTGTSHSKPYPDLHHPSCPGARRVRGLVLGTDFVTDVSLLSIRVEPPAQLRPGFLATKVALRTLCQALTKAATIELGLEPAELDADFRTALTQNGQKGFEAEIYLYDTLPGGAGFARRAGELGQPILERALTILEECSTGCDSSCYRCLRKFANRLEHPLLDRHLAASLLRYLLMREPLILPDARLDRAYSLLVEDLRRNCSNRFTVQRDAALAIAGLGTVQAPILLTTHDGRKRIVDLHHPLIEKQPFQPQVQTVAEHSPDLTLILDELLVRRNLPGATASILKSMG